MAEANQVVCVGDALVDVLTFVSALPARGGAAWSPPPVRSPGGTAANVAAGLAALGVEVAYIGVLGNDDNGRYLLDDLRDRGVDISAVIMLDDSPTGVAIAMIEPNGERTFIAAALQSSYTRLTTEHTAALDRLNPGVIYISGVQLRDEPARSTLVSLARSWNGRATLYFDTNMPQLGPDPDPNCFEAIRIIAMLSNYVVTSQEDRQALGLKPGGRQRYVIKLGEQGASLIDEAGEISRVAGHRVTVVDLIGAGDAFNAAFIAARYNGMVDEGALRFANAAAALSVTRPGGRAMPTWEEAATLAGV